MKISVRSYLIAGVAFATTGLAAVTPLALPPTPFGAGIASAQPADDDSSNQTDRSGTSRSALPGTDRGRDATRNPTRSSVETGDAESSASAVASQGNRGTRSRLAVVSGAEQTSTDDQGVVVRRPSRVTVNVDGDTSAPGASNDEQSFGAVRHRVRVSANGSIRPHTQVAKTRSVTRISATGAAAADTASAPSPGRTINAAVQRALAGQTSATAHATATARARSSATFDTEQVPAGIRGAQPARSSSPYAGNQ